jgi:hypothetical protein
LGACFIAGTPLSVPPPAASPSPAAERCSRPKMSLIDMPLSRNDKLALVRYQRFSFDFPERTLKGLTIVLAGATGGPGAAISALLPGEGPRLTVGYRFGRPEDVARAIPCFLEPDGYSNGQTLVVDGGLSLRRRS